MYLIRRPVWRALAGHLVEAAVPHVLTFQGRLKDSTGTPYSGPEAVTFAIYDKDSAEIWNSGALGLTFSDGLVTVQLGEPPQPPLPAAAWASDTSLMLGITIARDPELAPRIPLYSVGHSFHALNADRLGGLVPGDFASVAHSHALDALYDVEAPSPSDGQVLTYNSGAGNWQPQTPSGGGGGGGWTDDGHVVRLSTVGDRVGAGTAAPLAKLEIRGKGTDKKSFNDNDVLMVIPDSPFVGINRDFKVIPQEVFGVHSPRSGYGGMFVSTPTPADFPFYGYSGAGALNAYHYVDPIAKSWNLWSNFAHRMVVDSAGNLGVGTASPEARIHASTSANYDVAVYGQSTGAINAVAGRFVSKGTALSATASDNSSFLKVGIETHASGTGGEKYGVAAYATSDSPDKAYGVYGKAWGDTSIGGYFDATGGKAIGVSVTASGGPAAAYGVKSVATGTNSSTYGVWGEAHADYGMGVYAQSYGANSQGLVAYASGEDAIALIAQSSGIGSAAGVFSGDVAIYGTLSKSAGSFRIDHPLDPENKYLQHSFVESPDMMNVYNGNVILDENGRAVVVLPSYFEVLNRDFRYQLTAIGEPGPNLYIASRVAGNIFSIGGGAPGMEVSWQVTGVRKDAYAKAHRIEVELAKRPDEQGKYLSPELYGLDERHGLSPRPHLDHDEKAATKGSR